MKAKVDHEICTEILHDLHFYEFCEVHSKKGAIIKITKFPKQIRFPLKLSIKLNVFMKLKILLFVWVIAA